MLTRTQIQELKARHETKGILKVSCTLNSLDLDSQPELKEILWKTFNSLKVLCVILTILIDIS